MRQKIIYYNFTSMVFFYFFKPPKPGKRKISIFR